MKTSSKTSSKTKRTAFVVGAKPPKVFSKEAKQVLAKARTSRKAVALAAKVAKVKVSERTAIGD